MFVLGGEDYCWSVYRVGRALWTATKLSAFGCAYDDEKSAVGEVVFNLK